MTEIESVPEIETIKKLVDQRDLVVFNDDINTFDHVINSLITICKHKIEQAEQCTFIIHYKGKCQVKRGEFEELKFMCTALLERGLSAEVQ